jgi:hypothetical protein
MPPAKTKPAKAIAKNVKARVPAASKRKAKRTANGIPLKRKVIWVYDVDSPEFELARQRELREIKRRNAERDGLEFIEMALADPEVQKWWK